MQRKLTLIEIGAGPLPVVTPVVPRQSSWFPVVYVSPDTPPVEGVVPVPVADGVLIEWAAVDQDGVIYIIERGPSENGPWAEIHRTTETRYFYSDGSGQQWWFKITASVRGKAGEGAVVGVTPGRVPSYEEMEELNNAIGQEILDRLAGDLKAANDAIAAARMYTDGQVAVLNGILQDIVGADEWVAGKTYPVGDFVQWEGTLYRALLENMDVIPGTAPATWQEIGDYTSVGEALAVSIGMSTQNASDILAESIRLDAVVARMPAGSGGLATDASVSDLSQATADGMSAMGQRLGSVEAKVPADGGRAASASQVASVEQARANGDSALGQRIDQTNAALAGKAEAGTVQQIQSKVEDLGGKVDASAQAIAQVNAKLPASPQEIVRTGRFTPASGVGAWQTGVVQNDPGHASGYVLRVGGSNGYEGGIAEAVPCSPGEIIDLRADCYGGFMPAGTGSYFALHFINAAGETVSHVYPIYCPGGSSWRYGGVASVAVPAGACRVRGVLFSGTSGYALWQDLSAKRRTVSEEASASATQSLSVRATQLENGQTQLMAQWSFALDVNGRAIGMTALNNGVVGRIDIVSDIFSIVDPNNTGSTTFEGGRWITRSGGFMMAHGKPFGITGDLMMWFGIGSAVGDASKANGLFWIDNRGNSYFGGSLSAGTLRNAVQTGTTQTVGTELLNGPFRTNGGNRTVTLSFVRTHQRQRSTSGTSGFVAGGGANTAQVQLFRQIGTGAWVHWQTLNVTGSVNIVNQADGPDTAVSSWSGSFTVNDSSSPQETVSYLARVVAFGEQTVTHQAGSFDAQTLTQNLSIISVEQ